VAELLDRVAVVTGAAGVVGAAVAQRFAEEGARIVLVDEDQAGSVSVNPGTTTLTVILNGPRSLASWYVRPWTPDLDAL
jgi:NAD(P)-dependent dehydrogenase (short-subunit alcohol dehydrogenase family)